MTKIVVVDDDEAILELVSVYLEHEGYVVIPFSKSTEVMAYLEENMVDGLILDVMMEEVTGIELLKQIRENYSYPVIMLTAKTEQQDVLRGLYEGADDYIKKPFDPLELLARLKVHLRRNEVDEIVYRNLILNKKTHVFTIDDKRIELTPIEFQIVEMLLESVNEVIPSEKMFEAVWAEKYFEKDSNTVSVHIRNIRYKVHKANRSNDFIKTVWGVGYKIE